MLPFSKRPPPPDEYLLRSGDLECASPLRQDPYSVRTPVPGSYAPASYPPPASYAQQHQSAPPPAFVRQAAPTPYGFTQNQQQQQYGQRNDLSAPPPPHSLAPMAMSADSTNRQFANTGISRAQSNTMSGRDKPSIKWGIMIALSGALLGGVLGLGMDARRQSARAAAAAEAKDAAPPAVVAAVQPAPVLPVVIAPTVVPQAVAVAAQPPVAQPPVAQPQIIPPAPVVLAVGQGVVVPKGAVHTKPVVKPHGFLAAKVTPPVRPAPEPKAEAPEPKTAKADKADPPKVVKKDANTSDAQKILEAANRDTTNTL